MHTVDLLCASCCFKLPPWAPLFNLCQQPMKHVQCYYPHLKETESQRIRNWSGPPAHAWQHGEFHQDSNLASRAHNPRASCNASSYHSFNLCFPRHWDGQDRSLLWSSFWAGLEGALKFFFLLLTESAIVFLQTPAEWYNWKCASTIRRGGKRILF